MTNIELRQWIDRRRLTHREAAEIVGLSLDSLRQRLYSARQVGTQTARIVELYEQITDQHATHEGMGR